MKDLTKIKELIVQQVPLVDVMLKYRVNFAFNPRGIDEVQFKCAFHGQDNKPSARLYNNTNSCYCWVCKKSWDVISFISEKENLNFAQALKYIVDQYKIDTSSIPDDPTMDEEKVVISEVAVKLGYLRTNINGLKYRLPLDKYRAICSVYLMIAYAAFCEKDVMEDCKKLEDKIISLKGYTNG